jgi:hypothetical protein
MISVTWQGSPSGGTQPGTGQPTNLAIPFIKQYPKRWSLTQVRAG